MSSYEDIGSLLKQVRLSHGLSAHELSRTVHIRERYIVALEAGDIAALPGTAYARAYIERLLEFMEHDATEALAAFDAATDEPHRRLFQLSMRWGNSVHPTPKFVFATTAAAIAVLLIWNLFNPIQTAPLMDAPPAEKPEAPAINPPVNCAEDEATTLPCFWRELGPSKSLGN